MPEGPSANEKTVAEVNALARNFYGLVATGSAEGYPFARATHPWEPLVPASLAALVLFVTRAL